jgi:hypothetical protein
LRVLDIHPVTHGGDGNFPAIARFTLEVTPDLRLPNWTLRRAPRGDHIVLPPNAMGRRAANITPTFAKEVVDAAVAAFKELSARAAYRH